MQQTANNYLSNTILSLTLTTVADELTLPTTAQSQIFPLARGQYTDRGE